jgi:iron-sulfur cluster repair protein YtfE (RIC family)
MITQFHTEHREIVALANRLIRLINPDSPPSIENLTKARVDLAASSDAHLARETRFVERMLGVRDDVIAQGIAKRYRTGLMDLQLSLAAHTGRWNPVAIRADWAGYRAAVRDQLAVAVERMSWEERVVFPLIQQLEPSTATAEKSQFIEII